jgi:hypothetical protein
MLSRTKTPSSLPTSPLTGRTEGSAEIMTMNASSALRSGLKKLVPSPVRNVVRYALGPYKRRQRRLTRPHDDWSIGLLSGPSPFALAPYPGIDNPVLTRRDVSDRRAAFVADPFLLKRGTDWYLFFEVYNRRTERGEIAVATSTDGVGWTYRQVVLVEPFHLSYPYVFEWEGEVYMIPEGQKSGQIRLYRARNFPYRWDFVGPVLDGGTFVDPSIFRHQGLWWLYVETNPEPRRWDTLRLFSAKELLGPWSEHPSSPVTVAPHTARPAGRVIHVNGNPVRFAQVCEPDYGTAVRGFEVRTLTVDEYEEAELPSPVLTASGRAGWTETGMHHLDALPLEDGTWIAAVDGCALRASAQAGTRARSSAAGAGR